MKSFEEAKDEIRTFMEAKLVEILLVHNNDVKLIESKDVYGRDYFAFEIVTKYQRYDIVTVRIEKYKEELFFTLIYNFRESEEKRYTDQEPMIEFMRKTIF